MSTADQITYFNDTRRLHVVWSDGHESEFPYIWLRHWLFFPATGRPGQVPDAECLAIEEPSGLALGSMARDGDNLVLAWSHDGTKTSHSLNALRDACPSDWARKERQRRAVHWDKSLAEKLPQFAWAELSHPERRLALLLQVRDYGFALLSGVPPVPGTVVEVGKLFGPIRVTHYGTLFDVRSKPADQAGNRLNIGAVASNSQAPHTDESYRQLVPGIAFFHCLKADPGKRGASVYLDAFAAAERLRHRDPRAFELLSSIPMLYAATRNPLERFRARGRVIATDDSGVIRGIRFADRTMPPIDLAVDLIEPAYRALGAFRREAYDYSRGFEKVLQPGECTIFDNHRILHTRRSFDGSAGERWLQQVSVDRDEFHNTLQVLATELGRPQEAMFEQDNGALTQASLAIRTKEP